MKQGIHRIEPGKWHLEVRITKKSRNGERGQDFRKRVKFTGTKAQADERYQQIKQELRYGSALILKTAKTFWDLIQIYREKKGPFIGRAEHGMKRMEKDLGEFEIAGFEDKFELFMKIYKESSSARTKRKPTIGTINRIIRMVKAVFNFAVKLEVLEKNPITTARFPTKKETARDRVLTP